MLDWLIVGGGIHGTLIARCLLEEGEVDRERLRVLDPHPSALHRWRERAANTGMEFLRSPGVHHLGRTAASLAAFASRRSAESNGSAHLKGPYRRPSRAIFDAHAESVIRRLRLETVRIEGWARRIDPPPDRPSSGGGLRIETDRGELRARRVLLATGAGERLHWPGWAAELRRSGAPIHHLYEPGYRPPETYAGRVVVVGGGLSAVETGLALARRSTGQATLVARHDPRLHPFDTDSGWLGPKRMRTFRRNPDWDRRRRLIDTARHRGSVPPEVAAKLAAALRRGELDSVRGEVRRVTWSERLELVVAGEGEDECRLEADLLLLATGFAPGCPRTPSLGAMAERFGERGADCGYPVTSPHLEWYPGLFACGPLAELELGPTAHNLHGARLAARRLVAVARE